MIRAKEQTSYKECLNKLILKDLINVLDIFKIEYNKKAKKDELISAITDNADSIVKHTLDLFKHSELLYIKYVIKKKGNIKIKSNYMLLNFMNNMIRWGLAFKKEESTFYIPVEIVLLFKKSIKSKKLLTKIKKNTKEYQLLHGIIDVYGVVDLDFAYEIFNNYCACDKKDLENRFNDLYLLYQEFNIIKNKKKTYISSSYFDTYKACSKLLNNKDSYETFSPKELIDISTFKYMNNYKSYKKLIKYIDRNYYLEKSTYEFFKKKVLEPYFLEYQNNKDKSKLVLSDLIDQHFEFSNDKNKNKFIALIEEAALDYPKWELKGKSERKALCSNQKI